MELAEAICTLCPIVNFASLTCLVSGQPLCGTSDRPYRPSSSSCDVPVWNDLQLTIYLGDSSAIHQSLSSPRGLPQKALESRSPSCSTGDLAGESLLFTTISDSREHRKHSKTFENIRKPMDAKWKPMEAVKMCGCAIWPEKPLAGHFGQSHERCSAVMVCRSRYSRKKREFICAGHQGIWMDMDGFDYLWMFLVSNKDDFQVLLAMLSLGVPPPFEVTTLQAGQRMLTSVALTP